MPQELEDSQRIKNALFQMEVTHAWWKHSSYEMQHCEEITDWKLLDF